MAYTEVIKRNGREYFYRAISIRSGSKVSKKKIYLGSNLSNLKLKEKESEADKKLSKQRSNKELEIIKPKIINVLKENKVDRAGIFGSFSRGEQRKDSDIDIVVNIPDKRMSLLGFVRLMKLLELKTGRKVDLVEYSALKERIKDQILKEEVRII